VLVTECQSSDHDQKKYITFYPGVKAIYKKFYSNNPNILEQLQHFSNAFAFYLSTHVQILLT